MEESNSSACFSLSISSSNCLLDPPDPRAEAGHNEPADVAVDQAIEELKPCWKNQHRNDLRLRHRTGGVMVRLLGPSGTRQHYGRSTCDKIAKAIDVSRSELSRMRKFATAHPDLERFQTQHSELDTWTKVKNHLGCTTTAKAEAAAAPTAKLCRGLQNVIRLIDASVPLASPDWDSLRNELQNLSVALTAAYGISIRIETTESESMRT